MPVNYPNLVYNNDFGEKFARNLALGVEAGTKAGLAIRGVPGEQATNELEEQRLRNAELSGRIDLQPDRKRLLELQLKEQERGMNQPTEFQFKAMQAAADPASGVFFEGDQTGGDTPDQQGKLHWADEQPITTAPDGRRIIFSPKKRAMALEFNQQKLRGPSTAYQLKDPETGEVVAGEVISPGGERKIQTAPRQQQFRPDPNDHVGHLKKHMEERLALKAELQAALDAQDKAQVENISYAIKELDDLWARQKEHLSKSAGDPTAFADVEDTTDPATGKPIRKIKRKVSSAQLDAMNTQADDAAKAEAAEEAAATANGGMWNATKRFFGGAPAPSAAPAQPASLSGADNFGYVPGESIFEKDGTTYLYIGDDQWEKQE